MKTIRLSKYQRWFTCLNMAGLLIMSVSRPSYAFESVDVPGGKFQDYHRKITNDACKDSLFGIGFTGFSKDAIDRLIWANSRQDNPLFVKYNPAHHFDRSKGKSHRQAFMDGRKYVAEQIKIAADKMTIGKIEAALDALGRALHALQDFFSHSNFVDELSFDEQDQCLKALFDIKDFQAEPPANLRITAYDKETGEKGKVHGDTYAHDDHCKDGPDTKRYMSAGKIVDDRQLGGLTTVKKTAFHAAYDNAVDGSRKLMLALVSALLLHDLGDQERKQLLNSFHEYEKPFSSQGSGG